MDLINAAKNNNLEHVKLLVEQGADKDKSDDLDALKALTADMVILQTELVSYMDAAKANQKKVKRLLMMKVIMMNR